MTRITAFVKSILSPSRSLGTGPKANPGGETKSTPIIEKLIKDLSSKNHFVSNPARLALGKIGKDAIPHFIIALNDKNADVRCFVAWALGYIGPDARDAVPALTLALKDENIDVRECAEMALGTIEKGVIPYFIINLKDESPDVRIEATFALGRIGPDAKEAVPALTLLALNDEDALVRPFAKLALEKIELK